MSIIIGHALIWAIIDLAAFGAAPPPALPDLPDPTEAAIAAAFPEPDLYRQAIEVANCESRGRPRAVGDRGASIGVFQIQNQHWHRLVRGRDLTDPAINARIARAIYDVHHDWRFWTCQPDRANR